MNDVAPVAPHDAAVDELYAGLFDAPPPAPVVAPAAAPRPPPPSLLNPRPAKAAAADKARPDQQQPLLENSNATNITTKGALVALFDEARLADLERAAADARRDAADARRDAGAARAAEQSALDGQRVLRRNISSLWLTARLEVGRLREEVAELRARVRKGEEGRAPGAGPVQQREPRWQQQQPQPQPQQPQQPPRPPPPQHHSRPLPPPLPPHQHQQQQHQHQHHHSPPQQPYHHPHPHPHSRPRTEEHPPAKRPRGHDH